MVCCIDFCCGSIRTSDLVILGSLRVGVSHNPGLRTTDVYISSVSKPSGTMLFPSLFLLLCECKAYLFQGQCFYFGSLCLPFLLSFITIPFSRSLIIFPIHPLRLLMPSKMMILCFHQHASFQVSLDAPKHSTALISFLVDRMTPNWCYVIPMQELKKFRLVGEVGYVDV